MVLDKKAISNRRVSLDEAGINEALQAKWVCHYCAQRFTKETMFMRHNCQAKKRAEESTSPVGMAAFAYYNEWMRAKKFKNQSRDAFIGSRYYRAFIKFAELMIRTGVQKPEIYIEIMVNSGLTPDLWCRSECFQMYLDWIDRVQSPMDQVLSSIDFIIKESEHRDIDYTKFFSTVGTAETLALILQRKISPWFFFHSKAVQAIMQEMDAQQKQDFAQAISVLSWQEKLSNCDELRAEIRSIVQEVGL